MTYTRRTAIALIAGTTAALSASKLLASADHTSVAVELWDRGLDAIGGFDSSTPYMLATPGAALLDSAPMGIRVDKQLIPAGEVEFTALNSSSELVHEMIVLPISDLDSALPYDEQTERFDEDAAGAIGEISETDPGASGTLTVFLKPGTYMLACNIPGHYAMGMWTLITVE